MNEGIEVWHRDSGVSAGIHGVGAGTADLASGSQVRRDTNMYVVLLFKGQVVSRFSVLSRRLTSEVRVGFPV